MDGRSGAGKTRLSAELAAAVRARGGGVVEVHLDQLYPGWDGLEGGVDRLTDGVLRPFAAGAGRLRLDGWDWTRDRDAAAQWLAVPPGPVVLVVEGVGAGARRCREAAGPLPWLLLFLHAPAGLRRARALARDGDAYAPHWTRWAAQEQRHLRRENTRARADLVWSTAGEDVP